jgi:hypothetical protein
VDATRRRRTLDAARQQWYGWFRSRRFARHMLFVAVGPFPDAGGRTASGKADPSARSVN